MKRLLFIPLTMLIMSCSMIQTNIDWYDITYIPNIYPIDIPESVDKKQLLADYPEILFNWCVNNIRYEFYANGFHSAQQTLDERKGNCANLTLVFLALYFKITGIKGDLVYCANPYGLHYTPRINGIIIEKGITQIYDVVSFDDITEYIKYK